MEKFKGQDFFEARFLSTVHQKTMVPSCKIPVRRNQVDSLQKCGPSMIEATCPQTHDFSFSNFRPFSLYCRAKRVLRYCSTAFLKYCKNEFRLFPKPRAPRVLGALVRLLELKTTFWPSSERHLHSIETPSVWLCRQISINGCCRNE